MSGGVLVRAGLVAALAGAALAATGAPGAGRSPLPPCPPGTPLLGLATDITNGQATGSHVLTATHRIAVQAGLITTIAYQFAGDTRLRLTPPPGITFRPLGAQYIAGDLHGTFVAPATPGRLPFTATWNQTTTPTGPDECIASASFTVTTVAADPVAAHALRPRVVHVAGHPGRANALRVGWSISLDAIRGDATPITVTARVATAARAPSDAARAVTARFAPYDLMVHHPIVVRSRLAEIRLTAGGRAARRRRYAASVAIVARPPRGAGVTHRGVSIDVMQGIRSLAHVRFTASCTEGRGALRCRRALSDARRSRAARTGP